MVDKATLGKIAAKVVRIVPGIGTYQDKETLRDIDKRLREHLASILNKERGRVNEVKMALTKKLKLDPLDDLDRLSRKMHRLADTITFASYGWSAIFDQASVNKERLESLYEFDKSLEEKIALVQGAVDTLAADLENGLDEAIAEVDRSIGTVDDTVQKRDQLLKAV